MTCGLVAATVFRSRWVFFFTGQLVRIFLNYPRITNQAPRVFHGLWERSWTVSRENESQTFNCVSGGKFQDFGYLMKILSLDSFPMRCQNGRRVNVWTVHWRPRLLTLREFRMRASCVCLRLEFQHDCFHIEAALTSTSECLLWPIHVQVPRRTSSDTGRIHSLPALLCLSEAWTEESGDRRR